MNGIFVDLPAETGGADHPRRRDSSVLKIGDPGDVPTGNSTDWIFPVSWNRSLTLHAAIRAVQVVAPGPPSARDWYTNSLQIAAGTHTFKLRANSTIAGWDIIGAVAQSSPSTI